MAPNGGRKGGNGDAQYARAIRRLDSLERITANLVRYGVSLRSDLRRHDKAIVRIDAALERAALRITELTEKLDALIDVVDDLRNNS
jgi:hypothetical protein